MGNFKHRKSKRLYRVKDLYVIHSSRMVKVSFGDIRYINQCFIGIKRNGKYYELHSNVLFNDMKHWPEYYEKPFINSAYPLSYYTKLETIDEKGLFYLLNNINAFEASAIDYANDNR